jgi:hypothetical protein
MGFGSFRSIGSIPSWLISGVVANSETISKLQILYFMFKTPFNNDYFLIFNNLYKTTTISKSKAEYLCKFKRKFCPKVSVIGNIANKTELVEIKVTTEKSQKDNLRQNSNRTEKDVLLLNACRLLLSNCIWCAHKKILSVNDIVKTGAAATCTNKSIPLTCFPRSSGFVIPLTNIIRNDAADIIFIADLAKVKDCGFNRETFFNCEKDDFKFRFFESKRVIHFSEFLRVL